MCVEILGPDLFAEHDIIIEVDELVWQPRNMV